MRKSSSKSGKIDGENEHEFHLFVRPKDPKAERWEGPRSGMDAAIDVFNADEVCCAFERRTASLRSPQTGDINRLEELLGPIVEGASEIYTDLLTSPTTTNLFSRFFSNPAPKAESLARLLKSSVVKPLKPIINDIRVFKSDAEVANMRKAGQISGRVFTEAMKQAWTSEKDLGAFLDYRFKQQGCEISAYVPVVAGGKVRFVLYQSESTLTDRQSMGV